MNDRGITGRPKHPLLQAIPSLIVLVVVMVLLRGFSGAGAALKLQATTFLSSFFGGGDEFVRVLLHTTPLALSAGLVVFSCARRWIRFESPWAFVAIACIVLLGAGVGGTLREWATPAKAAHAQESTPTSPLSGQGVVAIPDSMKTIRRSQVGVVRTGIEMEPLGASIEGSLAELSTAEVVALPEKQSAIEQLAAIDWLAEPNLKNSPPVEIPPLNLLPSTGGVIGAVLLAINQLLGFLVAYQPRLFIAAVISGGWLGWLWHERLTSWKTSFHDLVEDADDLQPPSINRAA